MNSVSTWQNGNVAHCIKKKLQERMVDYVIDLEHFILINAISKFHVLKFHLKANRTVVVHCLFHTIVGVLHQFWIATTWKDEEPSGWVVGNVESSKKLNHKNCSEVLTTLFAVEKVVLTSNSAKRERKKSLGTKTASNKLQKLWRRKINA